MPRGVYVHKKKHGLSHSPTYRSWAMMLSRCKYPSMNSYKNYGGRGIRVCSAWQIFANFLRDVGLRPSLKYQLDRIDNEGHYEPGNVRWATIHDQRRNTRQNVLITFKGQTLCATDWALKHGLNPATVLARMYLLGWDPILAITELPSHRRSLYRDGKRKVA